MRMLYLGASPRGSLALFRTGQVAAALDGRDYVLPDDIKQMAVPVLAHRIIVGPAARLRELSAEQIVQEIVDNTPVPGGDYEVVFTEMKTTFLLCAGFWLDYSFLAWLVGS